MFECFHVLRSVLICCFCLKKLFVPAEYPSTTSSTTTFTPTPGVLVPMSFYGNVPIVLPINIIQGSVHITVSVTGKMFN